MNALSANDLKVGGVTAIEAALHTAPEAVISVRGDRRYVVMRAAQYDYLRECELEAAWLTTQTDRANGRAKTMTAAQHITDMQRRLQTTSVSSAAAPTVQQARAAYGAAKTKTATRSRKKAA